MTLKNAATPSTIAFIFFSVLMILKSPYIFLYASYYKFFMCFFMMSMNNLKKANFCGEIRRWCVRYHVMPLFCLKIIIVVGFFSLINCWLFFLQVLTLGLLQIHIAFVASKAVTDQQADESQTSNVHVAQQRIGDLGLLGLDVSHEHHHDHHEHDHHDHHEHDPGFWKKKVIWKEGWKKGWKAGKKQIWKPDWKKIWKPIWVPTQIPVWKEISVPAYKKIWKPKWVEIKVPAWKEVKKPDWQKIWKPIWVPVKKEAWKEIKVPDWKKIWKPKWIEIKVPAWKEIQVPAWKQYWTPKWIKKGVPGEKYLGKDPEGWEYTSHDLWKKKLVWQSAWKKIWVCSNLTKFKIQISKVFTSHRCHRRKKFGFHTRSSRGLKITNKSGVQSKNKFGLMIKNWRGRRHGNKFGKLVRKRKFKKVNSGHYVHFHVTYKDSNLLYIL